MPSGSTLAKSGTHGEPMFFTATVKNTKGQGVPGAKAEVVSAQSVNKVDSFALKVSSKWQADGDGIYDVQYPDRTEANDRGRIVAEPSGDFCYRGILPTAYPIVCVSFSA